MVRSCCAIGCTARDVMETREASVQFYRIPQKEDKRSVWVNAIRRKDWQPSASTVICSQHFVGGLKSDDPLSPAYVPRIFSFTKSQDIKEIEKTLLKYESVKQRKERIELREEERKRNGETVATRVTVLSTDDPKGMVEYPPHTVCTGTQTDLTAMDIAALEADYQQRLKEHSHVRDMKGYPDQEDLKTDEKVLRFSTSISSFTVLTAVFELVAAAIPENPLSKLSKFQSFILTLMKMRLNASNFDLGFRFGITETTVGRVFSRWVETMHIRLSFLVCWPDRESLQKTKPFCFRPNYGLRVTSIIDCFELFIEKPSNLLAKSCTWSQYKHYNTAKYLVSVTPQGIISYISNGRVSDKYIVENSGYLLHLHYGDVVLADRGFDVADSLALQGASLDIPTFTRGRDQLSPEDVEATRKLANVRIHVERIIGAVRQRFPILSATGVLPKELPTKKNNGTIALDSVVCVCCALNNVCEGIVPFN